MRPTNRSHLGSKPAFNDAQADGESTSMLLSVNECRCLCC